MKKAPFLTTKRAVEIFEEMVSCRRDYCADKEFFRATDVWKYLCEDSDEWRIKFFHQGSIQELRPLAAVAKFNHSVRLTVDARWWSNAERGDKLSNFVLAHELGHLQLRHNAGSAGRHFLMVAGIGGNSVIPQDYFELEANFAAVSFQCGVTLLDPALSAVDLADRAFCDVAQVKKTQSMVQLDVFRRELNRPRPTHPTAIF